MSNWAKDLKRGKDAEIAFLKLYPSLTLLDGYKGDFRTSDGHILELKSDFYSPIKWPNFIIERWSRDDKAGGPFQSLEHNATYFAYWFCNFDLLYVFDTKSLITTVNEVVDKHDIKLEDKNNYSYVTKFYRIPRILLQHIALEQQPILGVKNEHINN